MKRLSITTLGIVAALALIGAVPASSSAAFHCVKAKAGEPSSWENLRCTAPGAGSLALIEVPPMPMPLGNGVLCAKVKPGEPGTWKDNACTEAGGTKEYIKIVPLLLISLELGGSYPLHLQGSHSTAATSLGTASGVTLKGEGVTIALSTKESSSLGTFTSTFAKVEAEGEKCKTGTEPAGTVVSTGEFEIVALNAEGTLGVLYLPSGFEVTCGALKVKLRGGLIATLKSGEEAEELTSIGGTLEGTAGKQDISEYLNDNGTKVTVKLESNAGLEFVKADENIAGEVTLTALENDMFAVTGRW